MTNPVINKKEALQDLYGSQQIKNSENSSHLVHNLGRKENDQFQKDVSLVKFKTFLSKSIIPFSQVNFRANSFAGDSSSEGSNSRINLHQNVLLGQHQKSTKELLFEIKKENDIRQKRRTNRMLISMVSAFCICWLPLHLLHLAIDFLPRAKNF